MRILLAEYAIAAGLGGTLELEGAAMCSVLAASFERSGHKVLYPTSGRKIKHGSPIKLSGPEEFEPCLRSAGDTADAGLVIAPDIVASRFIEALASSTVNLGCSPDSAALCADKLNCTRALQAACVSVADIVEHPDPSDGGCRLYVIKPKDGCGSEGVRLSSFSSVMKGEIATRYLEGISLSASFVVGETSFLPLTINRQLIEMDGNAFRYNGSQVPYRSPRSLEIWDVVEKAAAALGLKGYAGMDLIVGERPSVVDVNARPTTSLFGIAQVMKEEIADLIIKARFGGLPDKVRIEGEVTFLKEDLVC